MATEDDAGDLEARVQRLIDQAIKRDPLILGAETGIADPSQSVSTREEIDLLWSAWTGVRDAVLEIAREIDRSEAG